MFDESPMRSVGSNGPMSKRQVEYHTPETSGITAGSTLSNMLRWTNRKAGSNTPNAALAGKGAYDFGSGSSANSGAQFQ